MYRRKKWCSQLASLYLWLKNTESIEAKYLLEDAKCRGQSLQVSYLKVSLFWYFNPVEALSNGIFRHLYRMKYTEWMKPPGKCLVKWVVECKLDYHHKISQKLITRMSCLVQLLPSNLSTTLPTPKLLQGFKPTFHKKNGSNFGALYQPLVDSIENIITVWLRTILPRSFAYKRFIVNPKLIDVPRDVFLH